MSYCSGCGAPAGPGRFCVNCGSPLTPADPPGQPPGAAQEASAGPPPEAGASGWDAYPPPAAATPNPFAGIPVSDYVRDLVAAGLLLVSLALPWDFQHDATARIDVVLITVLSVLSLLLPYLSRVGIFPPWWTVERLRVARLLANAPYLLLVLIYLVVDVVTGFSAGAFGSGHGLGAAAWVGVAGALLAAQPREAELTDPRAGRSVALWYAITAVCGALLAVTVLVTLARILTAAADLGPGNGKYVAYYVVALLAQVCVVAVPLIGTLRRSAGWRLVLIPVGVITLVSVVFLLSSNGNGGVESVHLPGYTGILFWIAAAAAAASPPVRRAMRRQPAAQRWITGALHTLDQVVVVAVVVVVISIAGMTLTGGPARGAVIFKLVAFAVGAVLAVLARQAVTRQPLQGRGMALVAAAVIAVLGLINVVVSATTPTGYAAAVGVADLLLLGLPVVTAIYLTVPLSIREFYAGSPLFSPGQWQNSSTTRAEPAPPFAAPPGQGGRTAESLAADPTTPMQILANLAYHEPALRPVVAANPAAYPDLLVWLGQLGDPAVDAALASRPR